MNTIEPSKSSRASCRTCKNKIDKGRARLGVETEFNMGGEVVTSIKWHHLQCGIDKIPEAVLTAEIVNEVTSRGKPITIPEEDLQKIEEFRKEYNKSGIAIQSITEIDTPGKTVNIKATVLRAMAASTKEFETGEEKWGRTVYIIDDGNRSRITLWEDHAEVELQKDDELVVIEAKSYLGGNDKIQFNAVKDSKVLINPTEEELEEYSESIELYISKAWNRPTGKPAEFTIAPSGRASCGYCREKISKGELKLVQPVYMEIETKSGKKREVPSSVSFHLQCMINDENGEEVLHEAITRLNLDQINDHHDILSELKDDLPDIKAKSVLSKLL